MSEGENDDDETWKQKVYQPTGPDGRGWGDNRKMSSKEQMILEELNLMQLKN